VPTVLTVLTVRPMPIVCCLRGWHPVPTVPTVPPVPGISTVPRTHRAHERRHLQVQEHQTQHQRRPTPQTASHHAIHILSARNANPAAAPSSASYSRLRRQRSAEKRTRAAAPLAPGATYALQRGTSSGTLAA